MFLTDGFPELLTNLNIESQPAVFMVMMTYTYLVTTLTFLLWVINEMSEMKRGIKRQEKRLTSLNVNNFSHCIIIGGV
jgi:hypothetical protein